mmetsp:Transcript_443/g.840  ORF Transcript_443/g.840 Transcript_443/m.840 type:complete len:244 (+) Transcript_443:62-793(+)
MKIATNLSASLSMCSRKFGWNRVLVSRFSQSPSHQPYTTTWETLREMYRTDPERILTYNDPLTHRIDGRVFKPDPGLLPVNDPLLLPQIVGWNLVKPDPVTVPDCLGNGIHLVGLSLRGGFDYTKSWIDPWEQHFKSESQLNITEIFLHEYSFLKYLKGTFIRKLQKEIPPQHFSRTIVSFGNAHEISVALLLPSKYTGYVYLVDSQKRVRWRGCGQAKSDEIKTLIECTSQLLRGTSHKKSR